MTRNLLIAAALAGGIWLLLRARSSSGAGATPAPKRPRKQPREVGTESGQVAAGPTDVPAGVGEPALDPDDPPEAAPPASGQPGWHQSTAGAAAAALYGHDDDEPAVATGGNFATLDPRAALASLGYGGLLP